MEKKKNASIVVRALLLLQIFGLPGFCWFWPATKDEFYSATVLP
jgi:hypothetical protein